MNYKILVADDSPTVRNVAESLLKKHGYEVLLADDGARALEVAKANKPDLIFLNDSMSILNGEQVLRELKQNKNLKDVPVVMLLSRDEIDKEQKLKQIGTDAFITKPFNPREILDHVERLLEKEKTFPFHRILRTEDKQKLTQDLSPGEDEKSDEEETQKPVSPDGEKKSEDILDIVETSDFMESLESSTSDGELAHGFDWFMSELKRETQEDEKANSHPEKKSILSEQKSSDKKPDYKKESKIYEIDEHQKGYEDFLKDLKRELEETDKEKSTQLNPSVTEEISRSQSDPLFSDLRERISQRLAKEVAKKISPEFLEKVIRDEMAKLGKDSF
ncbi:MAG: response regulator [candidate division Zixibacteria bacterium]|nr:response regulator [candidate division Zixibacteria bacterium]